MRETWVRSLGREDPLEKGKWQPTPTFWPGEIPWPEEPGGATVRGVAKSQTRLSDFTWLHSGNSNRGSETA